MRQKIHSKEIERNLATSENIAVGNYGTLVDSEILVYLCGEFIQVIFVSMQHRYEIRSKRRPENETSGRGDYFIYPFDGHENLLIRMKLETPVLFILYVRTIITLEQLMNRVTRQERIYPLGVLVLLDKSLVRSFKC